MQQQMLKIIAYGRVQGVGFRPNVCRIAKRLGLAGWVRNLGGQVELLVRGQESSCQSFLEQVKALPEPAMVERLELKAITEAEFVELYEQKALKQEDSFFAVASLGKALKPIAPADLALCPKCQKEMLNKTNRRHGYAYISCAQCGPRYTIMERLPYDRQNTSMKAFELCPACAQEYRDMLNRRGHAETISCNHCGPQLQGKCKSDNMTFTSVEALTKAQELLAAGKIILVKAIGGFNLVCRADLEKVVAELRELKQRPTKPFAIMVASVEQAKVYCQVNAKEAEILTSAVRPIVLLSKKQEITALLPNNVAGGCAELGVFLPSMGFYTQLCANNLPLIVTSCNFSGAPIIFKDEDAERFYEEQELVEGLFTYDRDILRPADDSVVRVLHKGKKDTVQVLRRTKGYMPEPITLANTDCLATTEILAVGAQMEPSVALSIGERIYPAQLPGDIEEEKTELQWRATVEDWQQLLQGKPQLIVGDLHPDYASTRLGESLARERKLPFLQVQHHHAHALAVMAEKQLEGPVLAVCFDGTGYGFDGTVWGGEFLLCTEDDFERVDHLEAIPMVGGDGSMQQAWKSALCYVANLEKKTTEAYKNDLARLALQLDERYPLVKAALNNKINTIYNSSMGRLFDAVATILKIADYNSHSGRCAQALEEHATLALTKGIAPLQLGFIKTEEGWSAKAMWPILLKLDKRPELVQAAALGFHYAVIDMVVAVAEEMRKSKGIQQLVLGGGCFANRILLEGCVERLQGLKFEVYFNEKVAPGDGGIALGQAYYGIIVKNKN